MTKKMIAKIFVLMTFSATSTLFAQQTSLNLGLAKVISISTNTKLPNFIKLSTEQIINENDFSNWAVQAFALPTTVTFKSYNVQKDKLGETHTRYKEYVNNIPVEGSMLITHSKAGRIEIINGDYFANLNPAISPTISESAALVYALKKVNASTYKWENKKLEAQMRVKLNQPDFTYYPKGELVIVHKLHADYSSENMRLAYKFNIYAEKPLSRAYIFVDAKTGEVISQEQIIHTADVVGTANTKYSGNVTMTSDSFAAGQYRLQEIGRGNGIATLNLNNDPTFATITDFTNSSNIWDVAGFDQAAADAHWGAESTYDYFLNVHGRNSIDDLGFQLNSFVHFDVSFANAFWDGFEMVYGDGDVAGSGFLIMTGLDVCGHEITHGLTQFTAGLNGGGMEEPDALNEGFSDIFGTSIEAYARPLQSDWIMGGDITCDADGTPNHMGLRDMSHPSNLFQPNCYLGPGWDATGEPHANNGPSILWYYLLCEGGDGINDLGNTYNITGITMDEARMIAFRGLTNYFTPSTDYINARALTIQAAIDLYGGCSPEVVATTNAWYAVGVGDSMEIVTPPVVSFSAAAYDTLCFNASSFVLTGGLPAGGFYSGDGVTDGSFNPETANVGTHSINYSYTDANGCSASASQNIYVNNDASCTVGIASPTLSSGILIYPNPNDGNFTISFNAQEKGNYSLKLTNTLGQIVYKDIIKDFTGRYEMPLNITTFGKGVYTVSLTNEKNEVAKKIVVY